jgi:hypothetical protein
MPAIYTIAGTVRTAPIPISADGRDLVAAWGRVDDLAALKLAAAEVDAV